MLTGFGYSEQTGRQAERHVRRGEAASANISWWVDEAHRFVKGVEDIQLPFSVVAGWKARYFYVIAKVLEPSPSVNS